MNTLPPPPAVPEEEPPFASSPPPYPPVPHSAPSLAGYAPFEGSQWGATPTPMSGQAVGSLICAGVGLVGGMLFLPLLASLAGIILGHLALAGINRSGGFLRGRGLAVAALVCGYGAIFFWLGIVFVGFI